MKSLCLKSLFIVGLLIVFSSAVISAQTLQQNPKNPPNNLRQPKLLQALGLSKEQIQQIRRINGERKISMGDAQMRLREATQKLDQAIYAESPDETEVQNRLKDVQAAQGEVMRIRFLTEFEIRKILTAEQLNKFTQLRQQFMERVQNGDNLPPPPDEMQNPPPFNKRRIQMRPKN